MTTATLKNVSSLFDHVHDEMRRGDARIALERLFTGLQEARADLDSDAWQQLAKVRAIEHPLREILHRDPMVRRSFEKPRGYAGDAVLIDYIYRLRGSDEVAGIGRQVYDYASSARPAALGVQARRHEMARQLDAVARLRPEGSSRVLCVACGHFREGHLSRAFLDDRHDEIVALDSDAESLAVVEDTFRDRRIRSLHRSVAQLLKRDDFGRFDLVYSSGLYDYLEARFARRLTRALFERLAPGGRLVLCNFVPALTDAGFMESFMGWDLVYRSEQELADLAVEIDPESIARRRVWTDAHDAVAYLELDKRA
ncbi:MAG: class I SAM-dependent methyltransferase [Planctomycetes bacterium]|nr:class I SAM-dependent methyltransferase [Planctomycetota bacterium]MCB9917647.1 class I SAM-dependent methyltransferase [Planctomycetota bacterium]